MVSTIRTLKENLVSEYENLVSKLRCAILGLQKQWKKNIKYLIKFLYWLYAEIMFWIDCAK